MVSVLDGLNIAKQKKNFINDIHLPISVSKYGEVCNHTDECADHRYNCIAVDKENTSRCLCDRFHSWMGSKFGCIQIFNATEIMDQTVKVKNTLEKLERKRDAKFKQQAIAGIFIISMVILAAISVIFYCIHMARSDAILHKSLKNARKSKCQPSTSSRSTVPPVTV